MRLFNRLQVIALFFTLLLLVACSSGGGGGTTSFTVSTSTGANGAISPASASVILNDTASFTVMPDTRYLIDTVSGCGGSLAGDTYTTGVITTDCTVSASFIERTLGAVSALFPTSAANWNDYVAGSDWSTVTDIACAAAIDSACLHGGEHRVVEATGRADCTGLSAADDLAAFNWVCDDSSGTARLISTGLADGKYLSDLIDFSTPGFRPNAVTIFENGITWGTTSSSSWWTNPVMVNNSGGSLDSESTVYLVTSDPAVAWTLAADKLALVIQPGLTVTGPGTGMIVIAASGRDYLWLEGGINASGDGIGVNLSTVRFSVLRKLAADNASLGVVLDDSNNNRLNDVTASNNGTYGTFLDTSNDNTLSGLKTSNNVSGVLLDNASNNTLSDLMASNSSSTGVGLTNASNNNTLSTVTVSNNSTGVLLENASNNTLSGVTASNNSTFGISLDIASNNNTLSALAARNNDSSVILDNASNNNTFSDVAASNSGIGIIVNSDNNMFTGLLEVGNNSFDCIVTGVINPGLVNFECVAVGTLDPTLVEDISLADSFVGKLMSDDALNASDTDGMAVGFPADPAAFDWTGFDNTFRGWGKDGSDLPNADHQGQWSTVDGRIWDWSVSSGDTGNNPFAALLAVFVVPTGNDTLTHRWNGTPTSNDNVGCDLMVAGSVWNSTDSVCETTYLRHAVEIQADGLGNDNTLCESAETCLYTPNIGSYQGHGGLISTGAFTAGTLTGITLMKYDSNGR